MGVVVVCVCDICARYQLPVNGTSLALVFDQIEAHRAVLNITDYSISQTTLEQIFVEIARKQVHVLYFCPSFGGRKKCACLCASYRTCRKQETMQRTKTLLAARASTIDFAEINCLFLCPG